MTFNVRLILAALLILWASLSSADWINLTGAETAPNIAEIYVHDDHVKVKLEVYFGDLAKFEELVPDEWLKDSGSGSGSKRPSVEKRMQTFASERLQIITDKGVRLPAKLVLVEARNRVERLSPFAGIINPTTRQRVKKTPADKRVLYAEIIYSFPGKDKILKPKQLQIVPPLDAQGMVSANIGFVAFHQAVPIVDFRYLGQASTLNIDWQDPWYTRFENKNLSRHHKYPLMVYLYVEPRQVRLESLMRINDIADMTGFNAKDFLLNVKNKRQWLQEHIKNYYVDKDALQIDGDSFKPDSIRVEFLNVTLTGLKVIDIATVKDEYSLLVGVSRQYLIDALPQKIDTNWQYFNKRINRIPVIVTDPVGPLQSLIEKNDPGFGWQNFLKTYEEPVIRPVDVETGWSISIPYIGKTKLFNQMPDQPQALSIVGGVLENIRIAFIEKEPGNFSRVLGGVVSTNVPDVLQKELGKLFSPKVTGGAVGAVQVINEMQIVTMRELEDPDGFSATINGSASIKAQHWGHIDQRRVEFQALFDLIEEDKQWKLADLTVIDLKELK